MWARRMLILAALFAIAALAGCMACDSGSLSMQNRSAVDGRAALEQGIALARDGKYDEAYATLKRAQVLLADADDNSLPAQATFWASYCREKSNDSAQARAGHIQVIGRYPTTTSATQANLRLAALDKAAAASAGQPVPAAPAATRPSRS